MINPSSRHEGASGVLAKREVWSTCFPGCRFRALSRPQVASFHCGILLNSCHRDRCPPLFSTRPAALAVPTVVVVAAVTIVEATVVVCAAVIVIPVVPVLLVVLVVLVILVAAPV